MSGDRDVLTAVIDLACFSADLEAIEVLKRRPTKAVTVHAAVNAAIRAAVANGLLLVSPSAAQNMARGYAAESWKEHS